MILTWLLTMLGFILIFVKIQAWSDTSNPHPILGVITTIMCFIQPIGAIFRPAPNDKNRRWFNWIHFIIGNATHLLASKLHQNCVHFYFSNFVSIRDFVFIFNSFCCSNYNIFCCFST